MSTAITHRIEERNRGTVPSTEEIGFHFQSKRSVASEMQRKSEKANIVSSDHPHFFDGPSPQQHGDSAKKHEEVHNKPEHHEEQQLCRKTGWQQQADEALTFKALFISEDAATSKCKNHANRMESSHVGRDSRRKTKKLSGILLDEDRKEQEVWDNTDAQDKRDDDVYWFQNQVPLLQTHPCSWSSNAGQEAPVVVMMCSQREQSWIEELCQLEPLETHQFVFYKGCLIPHFLKVRRRDRVGDYLRVLVKATLDGVWAPSIVYVDQKEECKLLNILVPHIEFRFYNRRRFNNAGAGCGIIASKNAKLALEIIVQARKNCVENSKVLTGK